MTDYKDVDVGYDALNNDRNSGAAGELPFGQILRQEIVLLKWRVLIFACILTFGSYYIYDFPGSIGTGSHDTIQSYFANHNKKYNQEMNQALYSVYSWPNTVLAFFGGILIDKILGLRKAMALFTALVFVGSVIFFIGVITTQYPLLVLGRVVFGLGGESLSVSQSAFVARWFKEGRGMALAFGITISFSRVGSSFNFLFSPMFAKGSGIVVAALCGSIACCVSVLACGVLVAMDIYGTRKGIVPPESKESGEPFKFAQLKQMSRIFWLVSLMCVTVYCAVFPLIGVAKNYFEVKYDLDQDQASSYVSVYQFVCAGGSPITGAIVDVVGRFSIWMIAAGAGFTVVHLLFLVAKIPPYVMMGFMGIVYSVLVSSLWPAVPYVVRADLVGMAYGLMTAMQNSGLATWPLIAGAILDAHTPPTPSVKCPTNWTNWNYNITCCNKTDSDGKCETPLPKAEGFVGTEVLFLATAAAGLLVAVVIFISDKAGLGVLGANPKRRKEIAAEQASLLAVEEDSKV